ncbi:MAG: alpha/beta hydrolase, partial [Planctomycetaceae bacterium]|nr:alpha/beta hydrolase [Planctomycetaceae bacterium]
MRRRTIWICLTVCVLLVSWNRLTGEEALAPTERNLAYDSHTRVIGGSATNLDLYLPSEPGMKRPVMVWIHGGAWKIGRKEGVNAKPKFFTDRGWVFASINYRLVPEVNVGEQTQDVANALMWVKQHAAEWGGDPEQLYVMGHSAGAHLAALVSVDERYLQQAKGQLSDVKGVILLDGAGYDVARQLKLARTKFARTLYEEAFGDDPENHKAWSPVTHVAADKGIPPFLILHCASRPDSTAQSEGLAEKLKVAGVSAKVVACEGKSH